MNLTSGDFEVWGVFRAPECGPERYLLEKSQDARLWPPLPWAREVWLPGGSAQGVQGWPVQFRVAHTKSVPEKKGTELAP